MSRRCSMLHFNNNLYQHALKESGLLSGDSHCYKEFINSEINYINHFLNYLNDFDVEMLLSVYSSKKYKPKENDMSKDSFRYLYNGLKNIKKKQLDVLSALYQGDPLMWQTEIEKLFDSYAHYISIRQGLNIPFLLEQKFKELEVGKLAKGLSGGGSLDSILISPIQRLPRYALLGRDLLKEYDEKLKNNANEALAKFCAKLAVFNSAMNALNQKINQAIACPLSSEVLTKFLRTPYQQDQQAMDEEPTSPYIRPSGKIKPTACSNETGCENINTITNSLTAIKRSNR